MPINYEAAKTLVNGLIQKMKSFRGNWEQNDPTADDYIKNRPFYTEQGELIIIPKTFVEEDDNGNYGISFVLIETPLEKGKNYNVVFDGVSYSCTCYTFEDALGLGNSSIITAQERGTTAGGEDTGEPFFVINYEQEGIIFTPTVDSHTIEITTFGDINHKIDKKYIPSLDYVSYDKWQDLDEEQQWIARSNIGASDFSGSYNDLINKPTIYTDVVRYNTSQSLTDTQKTRARTNIGAVGLSQVVRYDASQNLTTTQKNQAKTNIGAASSDDVVKLTSQSLSTTQKTQARKNIGAVSAYSELTSAPKYNATLDQLEVKDLISNELDVGSIYSERVYANFDATPGQLYSVMSANQISFGKYLASAQQDLIFIQGPETYDKDDGFATLKFWSQIHDLDSNPVFVQNFPVRLNGIANPIEDNDAATKGYIDNKIFDSIIFRDKVNSYNYVMEMRNGELVTRLAATDVTLTASPDKTTYMAGEKFDPTGMVIIANYPDGSSAVVENYSYDKEYFIEADTYIEVYCDVGGNYSVTIPVTVEPFDESLLQDFEYTVNDDGTYTITAWKGTLNGQPSTEMIVPDFPIINI